MGVYNNRHIKIMVCVRLDLNLNYLINKNDEVK